MRTAVLLLFLILMSPVYSQIVITYDNSVEPSSGASVSIVNYVSYQSNRTMINTTIVNNGALNITNANYTFTFPAGWNVTGGNSSWNLGPISMSSSKNASIILLPNSSQGQATVYYNFVSTEFNQSGSIVVTLDRNPYINYSFPENITIQAKSNTSQTLTVQSAGAVPINNVTVSITGLSAGSYNITPSRINQIVSGSSDSFNILFAPTTSGNFSFRLNVSAQGVYRTTNHNLIVTSVQNTNQNSNQNTNQNTSNNQNNQQTMQNPVQNPPQEGEKETTVDDVHKNRQNDANSEKSGSGLKVALIVIFVLILLGGAGFGVYYFINKNKSRDLSKESSTDIILDIPKRGN